MSKKQKEIFAKLNEIFRKDKKLTKIEKWLHNIKTGDLASIQNYGTVLNLFNDSYISLETVSEDGIYNLILKWISLNLDKFDGYNFKGIPPSVVKGNISIDLSNISSQQNTGAATNVRSPKKTFKTKEDVKRWLDDPETHPITGKKMSPMSSTYADIYEKAYKIMKKKKLAEGIFRGTQYENRWYYHNFPRNHRLFGNLDLLFHTLISETQLPKFSRDSRIAKNEELMHFDLCVLLQQGLENTEEKDTVLETEIELVRNRFSVKPIEYHGNNNSLVYEYFYYHDKNMIENLIHGAQFHIDPVIHFKHLKINDITKRKWGADPNFFPEKAKTIIEFMEKYKFSNGKIIIDYVREIVDEYRTANAGGIAGVAEFKSAIDIYDKYKKTYNDYYKLLDPNSGVVDNYENKKFDILEDPLDEFFKKYEEKLKKIKSPKFSNLIDLTSFTPVPNNRFLNDKQYKRFQRFKGIMEDMHKKSKQEYEKSLSQYESIRDTTPTAKSPIPPKRPTIKLENGQTYIYGNIEPKHIKDSLVKEFSSEYKKVKPLIDDYNKMKDMSYLELIKQETQRSPTENAKKLIKKHPLLSMNRKNINDNVLYDYTGNENKCSESRDILSNEEFDDENYPLAKLQLMVTLKFQKPNRTECVYAPKLYNLLVKSVNNKEPFINPVTRIKYSAEHIDQIMDIMKIIDPSIEIPIFLKPINDTKLFIDYKSLQSQILGSPSWKSYLNWYNICIYRTFGDQTYKIYDLCTIPADIESDNDFATASTDLTSNVMLFRIFKLFNEGRLLYNYVPPYYIIDGPNIKYINLMIHFNRYKTTEDWFYDKETKKERNKKEFIDMFKSYAEEINNFIY
jgi:hypothetical protein